MSDRAVRHDRGAGSRRYGTLKPQRPVERAPQVFGGNALAAAIAAAVGVAPAADGPTPGPGLAIDARLGWSARAILDRQRVVAAAGRDLLHVRVDGGLGLVGPKLAPGVRGCAWCAEAWRRRVLGDEYPADLAEDTPAPGATAPALWDSVVATAAAVCDTPWLAERLAGGVYVIRATDIAGRLHRFAPHPACPHCDNRPADAPAPMRLRPQAQADPERLRGEPADLTGPAMRAAFADWRYGPVAHVWRDENSPMCLVTTEMVRTAGARVGGYGRDLTYPHSERVALFEAFERAAGSAPAARHTVVAGSYRDLRPDAIDPAALGLPDPAGPIGPFVAYREDLSTHWVWGWSFGREQPVLVPEHIAYWQAPVREDSARFVYETSNGCALGASLEEAIAYGLFEVIERDSFLLAWHARLSLPALLPDPGDTLLGHMIDRLEVEGLSLRLYDMSLDHPIPSVLSLAVADDPERVPQAFFAAGAHPDPRRAVHSAAAEVVTNALVYHRRREARPEIYDPARLRPMLDDPNLVRTLDDHVALHTLPEARHRYAHLLHNGEPQTMAEAYGDWRTRWYRPDLTEVLTDLLADFAQRGLEVVAVDVTEPSQRDRLGLRAAKVLVPGTLPMTFGHAHRRLDVPRLRTVPVQRGYPTVAHTTDPHPFP